jgi:AAA+ ATPase superfamily predicted ATPase
MKDYIPVGKPVAGKDLIGREQEINLILNLLNQGQSVVLIAPRRFGKTSILLEVLKRLKADGYYTGSIDVFSSATITSLSEAITREVLANKKLDAAFTKLKENVKYLFRNIELKQEVENYEFILSFADHKTDELKLLGDSIDFIDKFAEKNEKRIVVGLDEFGDLQKFNGNNLVKLFRSKIQLQKKSAFIFSGSYESVMNNLFVTPKSPFYRFARIIQVGFIEREVFKKYIKNKLQQFDLNISDDGLDVVLDFTKGHPYYTQLFTQQLVISFLKEKSIDKKEVASVKENLLYIEQSYLEKVWEDISSYRENVPVLLALAANRSVYGSIDPKKVNIARSLTRLVHAGILGKSNRSHYFNDPLLQYWIQKKLSD